MPRISRCRLLCKSSGTPYAAISRFATRDITLIHGHAALSLTSDHQRYSGLVFISVIALGANLRDAERENGGYDGSDDSQSKVASRALLFPRIDNSLQVGIKNVRRYLCARR